MNVERYFGKLLDQHGFVKLYIRDMGRKGFKSLYLIRDQDGIGFTYINQKDKMVFDRKFSTSLKHFTKVKS